MRYYMYKQCLLNSDSDGFFFQNFCCACYMCVAPSCVRHLLVAQHLYLEIIIKISLKITCI